MPRLSDEELVEALLQDAPGAYQVYSEAYGDALFRFIAARTHHLADAEEIHNDALHKVLVTWRAGQGTLKSWLYRLAKQAIITWVRRNASDEPMQSLEALLGVGIEPVTSAVGGVSRNRAEPYRAQLRNYVETLPPGEQLLFQLCIVQDLTDQQVAALTGKKVESVKTMRCRLVKKIADAFRS